MSASQEPSKVEAAIVEAGEKASLKLPSIFSLQAQAPNLDPRQVTTFLNLRNPLNDTVTMEVYKPGKITPEKTFSLKPDSESLISFPSYLSDDSKSTSIYVVLTLAAGGRSGSLASFDLASSKKGAIEASITSRMIHNRGDSYPEIEPYRAPFLSIK